MLCVLVLQHMKYFFGSLLFLISGLFILVAYKYMHATDNQKQMNVILISVDTLRADHMGVYGYAKDTTPSIDRWAKDAFVFTNAYTVMPITFQSFYTLFTGKDDVLKNEIIANRYTNMDRKSTEIHTLAEILQENDFKTGAFITNPVVGDANLAFFKEGFQNFEYINTSGIKDKLPNIKVYNNDFENAKEVTIKGEEWLEKNQNNRFFLWLHYTTPHMPYNPPTEYLCKMDKNCNAEIYNQLLTDVSTTENGILKNCVDEKPSQEIIDASKTLYDAEILSVDDQIGQVFKKVDDLNLSKDTVIVFYADHGEGFENGIFGHGESLYVSGVKIPLIMKVPGKNPQESNHLIDNTDILPSLLDILKISYNKDEVTGKTFSNIFEGKTNMPEKKYVYSIATTEKLNKRSIFDGRYKYIQSLSDHCLNSNETEELYDLRTDPEENKNIVSEKREIKDKLKNVINNSGIISESSTVQKNEIIDTLRSLGY